MEENQSCYGERIFTCLVLEKAETQFFFCFACLYFFNSIFTKELLKLLGSHLFLFIVFPTKIYVQGRSDLRGAQDAESEVDIVRACNRRSTASDKV